MCEIWGEHKKPVGGKCQSTESTESTSHTSTTTSQNVTENVITEILNAVSYRLFTIEQRIDRTEEQPQRCPETGSDAISSVEVNTTPSQEVDGDCDDWDDAGISST